MYSVSSGQSYVQCFFWTVICAVFLLNSQSYVQFGRVCAVSGQFGRIWVVSGQFFDESGLIQASFGRMWVGLGQSNANLGCWQLSAVCLL